MATTTCIYRICATLPRPHPAPHNRSCATLAENVMTHILREIHSLQVKGSSESISGPPETNVCLFAKTSAEVLWTDKTSRKMRTRNTAGKSEGLQWRIREEAKSTSGGFLRTRQRGSFIENRNALFEGRFRRRLAGVANTAHTLLHCIPAVLEGSPIGPTPGPAELR